MLLFLFCIALAVRLLLLFKYPHVIFLHEADAIGYFNISKSIISTWGLGDTATHFPPFYPFLVVIFSLFFDDLDISGRLVSSVSGSLLIVPVYFIGRELYNRRVGLFSAILAIFFGEFLNFSLQPLTQITYVAVLFTAIYVSILVLKDNSLVLSLILGLISGAIYLTRPEGILFFFFVLVVISAYFFLSKIFLLRDKFKMLALISGGFLVLTLPYINYLHTQIGLWTISGKAGITSIGVDESAKLLPDGKTLGESLKGKVTSSNLLQDPRKLFSEYVVNLGKFLNLIPERFPLYSLVFVFLGAFALFKSMWPFHDWLRVTIVSLSLGSMAVVLPVFAFSKIAIAPSYILPLFPLMLIFLSAGIVYSEDRLFCLMGRMGLSKIKKMGNWSLGSIVLISVFSFTSIMPLWRELDSRNFKYYAASQKYFLKDTGTWIKNNTNKDSVIMTRWSVIVFYAEREYVYIADGDVPSLIKYAKRKNVNYLIIDSASVPRRRPGLVALLNPYASHFGLKAVYAQKKYGTKIIIYKVL